MTRYTVFIGLLIAISIFLQSAFSAVDFLVDTVVGGGNSFSGDGTRDAKSERFINAYGIFVSGILR